jgi:gluconate kinase
MPSFDAPRITLIDGRSGAGKSMFASGLAREEGSVLVSIDDVYPGWDGLDAGSWHIHHYLLIPHRAGLQGRYRPWLWEEGRPGDWIDIPRGASLIVEGCGALRRDSRDVTENRIWLDQDEEVRRSRAIERDGEMYAPHWTRWALQEERFLALHGSRDSAAHRHTLG